MSEVYKTTKLTTDAEEASKLIEAGFEYVLTTSTSKIIFKKRK